MRWSIFPAVTSIVLLLTFVASDDSVASRRSNLRYTEEVESDIESEKSQSLESTSASVSATKQSEADHRGLLGSNCILIERGTVPPYYDCVGCEIEEAQGCLDDMRYNLSGNVDRKCQLNSAMEFYDEDACCPDIRKDLAYQGSNYPEALRCIKKVGCEESVIYQLLLEECEAVCGTATDSRSQFSSVPICLAQFNAAAVVASMSAAQLLCTAVVSAAMALYFS